MIWISGTVAGQFLYVGTSAEAKPTPANCNGSCFIEIDTGAIYSCNGAAWSMTSFSKSGVATGTSLAVTGAITSSGTAGIGYAAGAGGTVTQLTNKSTGATLNKLCGAITMNAAALAAAAIVTFTVTNSTVAAGDVVVATHDSGGTTGAYTVTPNTSAAGSFKISVRNNTGGSLSEAIVIRFAVIKAVAA